MLKLTAILFVPTFVVTVVGLGWSAIQRFDKQNNFTRWERVGLSYGLGILVLHFGVFIVGRFRLDAISMGILALSLSMAAIPGWRLIPWKGFLDDMRRLRRAVQQDFLMLAMTGGLIVMAVSGLIQGMAPPNDYDSLMYHIALPQYDIEVGHIAPAWRWTLQTFFPALMENLYRFGLAIIGEPLVQMFHGCFAIAAAMAAAQITRELGFSVRAATLAALMFLGLRVVVWEMATCEVDLALSAYTILGLLAYMVWRKKGGVGPIIIFGAMIGGTLNVKYLGFPIAVAFGFILIADFLHRWSRDRVIPWPILLGPIVTLITFLPQMIYNYWHTRNPIFPLFNHLFNPGGPIFFEDTAGQYGVGRSLTALLRAPWDMSIAPTYFFDGVILGAPYLLAFLPFAILGLRKYRIAVPAVSVATVYYIEWFWLLSQQVRFLLPIFPIICVFASVGAATLWGAMRASRAMRTIFVLASGLLVVNQSLFVGIYAALRLPPAVGLISAETYHAKTPTLGGAFYKTCMYVRNNLQPSERYLSMLEPHFYYCPQASAIMGDRLDNETRLASEGRKPPHLSGPELLAELDRANIRFVIIQTAHENRRNETGQPEMLPADGENSRFGRHLIPILKDMTPLEQDAISAVYDGREARENLRQRLAITK